MADHPRREESGRVGGGQPVRTVRPPPPNVGPDLRAALSIVWRRKWSIIAITLLVFGLALFVSSRQTPIYESKTSVLVTSPTGVESDAVRLPDLNLATEAALIGSAPVAAIVADELGISGPPSGNLSVSQPSDTEILEIAYRHADPRQAQRYADAFASAYLQFRETAVEDAITRAQESMENQLIQLIDELNRVEQALRGLSEEDPNRGRLEGQANLLSAQITSLQIELLSLPDEVPVGSVIQPAPLPSAPVSPNHVLNGAFGVVAGLALAVVLAFLRDRLSERLRSIEEAEAYLEAPILASIPRVPGWRRRREALLVTAVQSRSPAAEAYRVLRTNVLAAASDAGVRTIAVTSPYEGEGKSSTVANLGVVLARAGKSVTLVSADLRRPRLHDFFKRNGHPGLIEVLAGRTTLKESLQIVSLRSRGFDSAPSALSLLPSGRVPDDPTELITSDRMTKVIADLETMSDIVLMDLPPVLPVTDALVVAAVTKYVLLVIGPRSDTRVPITSARQQLDRVGARILGGILNGADPAMSQTYYSY